MRRRQLLNCAPGTTARFGEPQHRLLRGRIAHICPRVETQKNIHTCVLRTEQSQGAHHIKMLLYFLLCLGPLIAASLPGDSELKIYAPRICDAAWRTVAKHRDRPGLARTVRAIKRLLINNHTGCPLIQRKGDLTRPLSQLARRCWCPNLALLYLSLLIVYRAGGYYCPPLTRG